MENSTLERSAELEIQVQLALLRTEVARLEAELRCPRCCATPPPPPRWPGDPWARDLRPACCCGRQRAFRGAA